MAAIDFDGITKRYHDGHEAVTALDVAIADGQFVIFVGPSGCGKSTALRMIAGLEEISEGELRIGDRRVNELAPKDRDVAVVFQSYALYPHMTVRDNMGFPLKLRGLSRREIESRVGDAARVLDLEMHLERRPAQLSGGQRQRVAMGRAIVREPAAFLMDEPLSNLDAKLRAEMRVAVAQLQRRLGTTTVYVTHDQTEAMTLGDRVAVLRGGVLQQFDTPQRLYDDPVNLFVAGFIGSPAMNMVQGELTDGLVRTPMGDLPLEGRLARAAERSGTGRSVVVGIRPEHFHDAGHVADDQPGLRVSARIEVAESIGSDIFVHFGLDAPPVRDAALEELAADVGAPERELVVARLHPRVPTRPGASVGLYVDPARVHLFDAATGRSVRSAVADATVHRGAALV